MNVKYTLSKNAGTLTIQEGQDTKVDTNGFEMILEVQDGDLELFATQALRLTPDQTRKFLRGGIIELYGSRQVFIDEKKRVVIVCTNPKMKNGLLRFMIPYQEMK